MIFNNPQITSLGNFTWAALQAAYPNGGAALAALPAGTTAWVSNLGINGGAEVTPSADKTRWTTYYPVTLAQGVSATINSTAYTNIVTVSLFGGLLLNHFVVVDVNLTITGAASTKNFRLQYDSIDFASKYIPSSFVITTLNRRLFGLSSASQNAERANATTYGQELASGANFALTVDSTLTKNITLDLNVASAADAIQASAYRIALL